MCSPVISVISSTIVSKTRRLHAYSQVLSTYAKPKSQVACCALERLAKRPIKMIERVIFVPSMVRHLEAKLKTDLNRTRPCPFITNAMKPSKIIEELIAKSPPGLIEKSFFVWLNHKRSEGGVRLIQGK